MWEEPHESAWPPKRCVSNTHRVMGVETIGRDWRLVGTSLSTPHPTFSPIRNGLNPSPLVNPPPQPTSPTSIDPVYSTHQYLVTCLQSYALYRPTLIFAGLFRFWSKPHQNISIGMAHTILVFTRKWAERSLWVGLHKRIHHQTKYIISNTSLLVVGTRHYHCTSILLSHSIGIVVR